MPDMPAVSLTERRKNETRLDIARTAAALFVADGLRATRAEDIARSAGVAPRTFYRYFPTKEESVAPLFAAGAQQWAEAVRRAPADLSVPDALRHAVGDALAVDTERAAESLAWVRALLRMSAESPALRAVWADACHASEQTLLAILAERAGGTPSAEPPLELRLAAAVASVAVRVAVETWAAGDVSPEASAGPAGLAERCLAALETFPWP
ncbi:TetR family transcriptional regulator [Streptomyces sp. KL118A]|uniref:TetR family transcriptional regulator n=1 Tax=Streptomyces sp. KL118A TaxID=3045153 RepID=UPI00278C19C3|nr:TetR family transcriptional regulator [Streptomyces sp. KL118A]